MKTKKFANILLKQGDNYLLQHRDDIEGIVAPNKYAVWGGVLEGDETFNQAAMRELKEETGLDIPKADFILIDSFVLTAEENKYRNYPVEVALFLVKIDEAVVVRCYEGQGIVSFSKLTDIPTEKLSFPLSSLVSRKF